MIGLWLNPSFKVTRFFDFIIDSVITLNSFKGTFPWKPNLRVLFYSLKDPSFEQFNLLLPTSKRRVWFFISASFLNHWFRVFHDMKGVKDWWMLRVELWTGKWYIMNLFHAHLSLTLYKSEISKNPIRPCATQNSTVHLPMYTFFRPGVPFLSVIRLRMEAHGVA